MISYQAGPLWRLFGAAMSDWIADQDGLEQFRPALFVPASLGSRRRKSPGPHGAVVFRLDVSAVPLLARIEEASHE